MFKLWRITTIPYSGTTPPKEAIFYKSKTFWLYLNKEYEEYPKYGYTIYWLDVLRHFWGFSFVPIIDIRCMSLALYNNQLVCLINDGLTSVWFIEEIENFDFSTTCFKRRWDYCEDDWGLKWNLFPNISAYININCHGYLPLRSVHGIVLMCNVTEVHFMLFDLSTGICLPTNINHVSMLHIFDSEWPLFEHHNPLIEKGNNFGIAPDVDFVDDIPPLLE